MDTTTAIAAVDTLGRRVAPRHFRTVEEKIQIVTESRMPGASVAEVARRHGVNANQVFTWRLQQRLLPVQVSREARESPAETSPAPPATPVSEGRIEITLPDGIRIAISGAVAAEQLRQLMVVLRR